MSSFEAIKAFLPSAGTGISRLVAGIATQRTAEKSAERLEEIGEQDARLRGIQAAELLGNLQASFGARGIAGGTADELEIKAARLEGIDIARARFRFTSLADQVRARGDAALFGSIAGTLGDITGGFQEFDRQKRTDALNEKILEAIAQANRTVLDPAQQKTLIPRKRKAGPKPSVLTTKPEPSVRSRILTQVTT